MRFEIVQSQSFPDVRHVALPALPVTLQDSPTGKTAAQTNCAWWAVFAGVRCVRHRRALFDK